MVIGGVGSRRPGHSAAYGQGRWPRTSLRRNRAHRMRLVYHHVSPYRRHDHLLLGTASTHQDSAGTDAPPDPPQSQALHERHHRHRRGQRDV